MRLTSEKAYESALDRWEALLAQRGSGEIELANEVFAVSSILRSSPSLNSALVDPSRSGDARAGLISSVLEGKVAPEVVELAQGMARDRWSQEEDLPKSLERIGVQSLLIGATREGKLHDTETQLFDIQRAIRSERQLRLTLNDDYLPIPARQEFVRKAFASTNDYTREMVVHAVTRTERQSMTSTLKSYIEAAAARSERLVASVVSVIPLTIEQEERLQSILSRKYGKNVRVHVAIDPDIVGGLRITVGDEVIDATLAKRIDNARESIKN